MYKIEFLDVSKQDLVSIPRYIKNTLKNSSAAYKTISLIINEISKLSIFPFANSIVNTSSYGNYRAIRVKNYLVFYLVESEIITITRIMYYRRDWKSILD